MTTEQRPLPLPAFAEQGDDSFSRALPTPEEHLHVVLFPDCRSFSLGRRNIRGFEICVAASAVGTDALVVNWSVFEVLASGARQPILMALSYDSGRTPAIIARKGLCQRTGTADDDPREVAAQVLREFV